MAEASVPIYTIGHSTRPIEEFVDILRGAGVTQLIDIRSHPRSRTNPQYNLDPLPETLAQYQISHVYLKDLGGRRPRQQAVDPAVNSFWQNQSFHNYADYATTEPFQTGLGELLALCAGKSSAVMCSEAVWWRCHRRIVADYLLHKGYTVYHLMGPGRIESAKNDPGCRTARELSLLSRGSAFGQPGRSQVAIPPPRPDIFGDN